MCRVGALFQRIARVVIEPVITNLSPPLIKPSPTSNWQHKPNWPQQASPALNNFHHPFTILYLPPQPSVNVFPLCLHGLVSLAPRLVPGNYSWIRCHIHEH